MEEKTFQDFVTNMVFVQYPNCVILLVVAWLFFVYTKIEVIVDFCWCLNYMVIGAVLFCSFSDKTNYHLWIQVSILTLWFMRLGGFLFFTRVLKGYRDGRYTSFVKSYEGQPYENIKVNLYFFLSFQIQAVFVVPCASTLYWVFRNNDNKNFEFPQ